MHGERAWFLNRDNTSRLLGIMYCGAYAQKDDGTEDDFLYIGMNFHWEKRNIALPNLPDGMNWKKIADTSEMGEPWFREQEEPYKKICQDQSTNDRGADSKAGGIRTCIRGSTSKR